MNKKTSIALIALCILLLLSSTLGAVCAAEHECSIKSCSVCYLAALIKDTLAIMAVCAAAAWAMSASGYLLCRAKETEHARSPNTPIRLKVKLSD